MLIDELVQEADELPPLKTYRASRPSIFEIVSIVLALYLNITEKRIVVDVDLVFS